MIGLVLGAVSVPIGVSTFNAIKPLLTSVQRQEQSTQQQMEEIARLAAGPQPGQSEK